MPRVTLTDRFIATVKPEARQLDYFDTKSPGLVLRVSAKGVKTWCLFYTAPKTAKRARATLGRYPQTSLSEARARAIEAKGRVDDGIDPRDAASGAMTVSDLAASYLAKHVRPQLRTAKAVNRRFTKNVLPSIGGIALANVHKRDVNRVIDPIIARDCSTEGARVFQDLRAMFRWGVARGDLDYNPMEGMRTPSVPTPRKRVLTEVEIRTLWNNLPPTLRRSSSCQRIIKLCLLTAQRVGEVSGISRDELDLDVRVWTIPGSRTKNKHDHVVPLSDAAIELIKEALEDNPGIYLFPDGPGTGSLRPDGVSKTITKAQARFGIEHWTAHDLRRTAVTEMARLGVAPVVLGHVINHRSVTKAGVTLSAYSHYDYAKEKREALELWADRLGAIVRGGAKVLPLAKGRQ
jgi:integrase